MAARRRNKAKRAPQRRGPSRWPVFLAGCATGAAAVFIVSNDLPRLPLGGSAPDVTSRVEEGAEPTPSAKLRYDFYTILPEMEVALPQEAEVDTAAAVPESVSPPEPGEVASETHSVAVLESGEDREEPSDVPAAPVVEVAAVEAPEPPKPVVSAVSTGGTYVLQVGSFRSAGDAERRRATLALLGLEARVQTVTIDGEATWHRVQVGPYDQLGALNDAKVRLRENDIEAMALKVRKP